MLAERTNLEYKMKKKIGFIALFIGVLLGTATAQSKLEFCVEVKEKGECLQPSKSFQVEPNGGTISFLVKNLQAENFIKLRYKIYYLRDNGDEDLLIGIDQNTQPDWQYAWQDVVLFDTGKYKVKVYQIDADNNESFLCLSTLSIIGTK